ncbi:initiation factor if-2, putative [Ichthyophthirius multifiliis]|uniref:Translation initiation factor IF-2, mitochondrial n=1 Tax=Ichthyophthirius multifiliis TaxID=5932 RepID=G0QVD2_ICHMU|nr:initiation factor if-2, putative [Ichthyophthirius multifiliis]EGR30821.1 initiation factor if-2, putative [Ichthyophthirius multifiliis]|eukprot:XP_004032408.1 initiation factor if-2, putative [Ichthyophthirius multifiliis]
MALELNLKPEKIPVKDANLITLVFNAKVYTHGQQTFPKSRYPVVTIMGHVDHGKTTILDYLRKSSIASGEYGGITQKIGAFHVITPQNQRITFIDTPGHEAFSNMRFRGANSTDIIILVVSAIEGLQPQTLEAIKMAYQSEVPMIVAINKIDVDGASPEDVEKQLFEKGKLQIEPFGGNIPVIHVSALKGINMDLLQELILFEAELLDLKAEFDVLAEGVVIESKKDANNDQKICSVIIQKGTLKIGDNVIIGNQYCRIRSIKDDKNNNLKHAYPSFGVEITGFKQLPQPGDVIFALENEYISKVISNYRIRNQKSFQFQDEQFIEGSQAKIKFKQIINMQIFITKYQQRNRRDKRLFFSGNKEQIKQKFNEIEQKLIIKLEEQNQKLLDAQPDHKIKIETEIANIEEDIEKNRLYIANLIEDEEEDNVLNIIIKANDYSMKETLVSQILKQQNMNKEMSLNITNASVGQITEQDLREAEMFKAIIIGMDIQIPPELEGQIKQKNIIIKSHKIIYNLLDDIKRFLQETKFGLKEGEKQISKGQATVSKLFEIQGAKKERLVVAGCKIQSGVINKGFMFRLIREDKIIEKNLEISSLKHFKKEVQQVREGNECGIMLLKYNDIEEGDIIEGYVIEK